MASNEHFAAAAGRCPCCDNPWQRAIGDAFAASSLMCATCEEEEKEKEEKKHDQAEAKDEEEEAGVGLSRSNMDLNVSPSDNFYRYANGGWMDAHPIPPGYPNWNTFLSLHVLSQERLKELLEGLESSAAEGTSLSEDEAKVAAFYAAALDEATVESHGLDPLQPLLDLCDHAVAAASARRKGTGEAVAGDDEVKTFEECLGLLQSQYGVAPFFRIGASPDNKNSEHSICQVSQGGLGLPDRDYYFDEDKADKRLKYKEHVAMMMTLLDNPTAAVTVEAAGKANEATASAVYDLELRLAEAHMTKTECRDPEATYNKMSASDLTSRCDGSFDFGAFFLSATGKEASPEGLGPVNVRNVAALERAAKVASEVEPSVVRHYLRWHAVRSCAPYLPAAFVAEDFRFNEKILAGTEEIKPRWKRAMAFTETALGEAMGKLYCAKHFDESFKDRASSIVERVRAALEDRLREVDWMSETTREAALKKMGRFRVKIGYPDKWIDYGSLKVESGESFLSMVFKARHFDHMRDVKEMNAPTDRDKWFMTPQTVNAYYHPSLNEIVFPAAILQPPFYNHTADDAVNFGAMGAVVGHEMTHGFDDKGRKFNADGNMIDWWTKEDGEEYERRVEVMVDQANSFQVHGQSVQGKLTCGENIADLGGMRLAYRALKAEEGFDDKRLVDGFSPTQRFFFGWAQCWRQNITKERALQLLTLDPHGPNEMRCNGPLSNIPEFHDAFGIKEGSPMYKPMQQRVDIW